MKVLLLITFLFISLFGDFSLTYKLDNSVTQKVEYKDDNHILFTILNNNKIAEKLIILNNKKYILFYENGIQHIYEISDELSQPVAVGDHIVKYKLIKKLGESKFNSYNIEKWRVKYANGEKNTEVLVSKDKQLSSAIYKVISALKKLLPADKQEQADMFNMGNGYVLLETGELKLLSYNKLTLPQTLFAINTELNQKEQKELSENINGCFTNVCCNKESNKSLEISTYLKESTQDWKLEKTAKCVDLSEQNIESAIYLSHSQTIVVEMTTGKIVPSGKILSLKEQGVKIENYQEKDLEGFKTISAYLPIIDATITDIMLPNSTISIFTKGKKELYNFAKQALKLKIKDSYSSNDI